MKKMNYISQINLFWEHYGGHQDLSTTAYSIYFALLQLNNRNRWKKVFKVEAGEVSSIVGIGNAKTFYEHLNKLMKVGLISFERAKNQYAPTLLSIKVLSEMPDQKSEGHGNSTETALSQHTDQHPSQITENQSNYSAIKHINSKTTKHETKTVFQDSILKIYKDFYYKRTSLQVKLNEKDVQALESLAGHLLGTNESLSIWKELLDNWKLLPPYFQSKITLDQIEKNFPTLIDQIKNHDSIHQRNNNHKENRPRATRKDYEF